MGDALGAPPAPAAPRTQRQQRLLVALVAAVLLVCGPAAFWPTRPPQQAVLHSRWMRQADGMTMVYVPAGEFAMGIDDAQLQAQLETCRIYNPG